jgi:hypothetical protein
MKLCLQLESPTGSASLFEFSGPAVSLGRNPDGDLVVAGDVVSWDHARIDLTPGRATLRDLNSSNGTFLNGRPVDGAAPVGLGDTVRLGQSGPCLKVLELDLKAGFGPPRPAPVPQAVARPVTAAPPVAAAVPSVRPLPVKPGPKQMSETRGILLEEIRRQKVAHSGHRRSIATVAGVLLSLLALLAVGTWIANKTMGRRVDAADENATAAMQRANETAARVDTFYGKFQDINAKFAEDEKQTQQLLERVEDQAKRLAQEEIERAKLDKKTDAIGRRQADDLGQLNKQLAEIKKKDEGGRPAPRTDAGKAAPGGPKPAEVNESVPFLPGQRIDLIVKSGTAYTGRLVSVTPQELKIMYIEEKGAKPRTYDMRDVMAIQTKDGIYALNRETGQFESALTYYRLDAGSDSFVKVAASEARDSFMMGDASISGESETAVRCLWSPTERVLALPVHNGPTTIQASRFKAIVNDKGVYEYEASKHDYYFKSHPAIAKEAYETQEAKRKQELTEHREWLMKTYEAGTRRLNAIANVYWRRWWWW